jgi:hypothetical protein
MKNKTVLSFQHPTPAWATWIFRIVFLLTTATTVVIAAEPDITDKTKVKWNVYLRAFDVVVWGIARGIGVKKERFTAENETHE